MLTLQSLFDSKYESINRWLPDLTLFQLDKKDPSVAMLLQPGVMAVAETPAQRKVIFVGTWIGMLAVHQAYPIDSTRIKCVCGSIELEKLLVVTDRYLTISELEALIGTANDSVLNIGHRLNEHRRQTVHTYLQPTTSPHENV